jgi:DNA mismatch repair protein MutS2
MSLETTFDASRPGARRIETGSHMPFPIGTEVLVRSLAGRRGVVVEVDRRNRHRVRMGAALAWCAESDLAAVEVSKRRSRKAGGPTQPADVPASTSGPSIGRADRTKSVPQIDLHGLTVEEAMARTVAAVDRALQSGADGIAIVHGKGSGRIRAALHRLLGSLPVIASFAQDERNPGVTRVRF